MGFRELFGFKRVYGQIVIGAKDIGRAIGWYGNVFGFKAESRKAGQDEVRMGYPQQADGTLDPIVTLVSIPEGQDEAAVGQRPILFTRSLNKVRAQLISKGVPAGPVQADSGGNHYFQFEDCEGNRIEVCLEPGEHSD